MKMKFFIACVLIVTGGVWGQVASANDPLTVSFDKETGALEFVYSGQMIFEGLLPPKAEVSESTMIKEGRVEQRIFIKGDRIIGRKNADII